MIDQFFKQLPKVYQDGIKQFASSQEWRQAEINTNLMIQEKFTGLDPALPDAELAAQFRKVLAELRAWQTFTETLRPK